MTTYSARRGLERRSDFLVATVVDSCGSSGMSGPSVHRLATSGPARAPWVAPLRRCAYIIHYRGLSPGSLPPGLPAPTRRFHMLNRVTAPRRSHLSVVVGAVLLTLLTLILLAVTPVDGRSELARLRAFAVREYLLPHKIPLAYAHDPAVAADGGVFFADQQGHYIGHLDPETGK